MDKRETTFHYQRTVRLILLGIFALLMMAATPAEEEVSNAGQKWLQLLDDQQFDASWKQAASQFRDQVTLEQWVASLKRFREPLGALVSRSTARVDFTNVLRGAPDASYAIIHYKTDFKNKNAVTERLTLVKEEGKWEAAAYAIH
jgi:hypothetical protein